MTAFLILGALLVGFIIGKAWSPIFRLISGLWRRGEASLKDRDTIR